MNIGKKIVSILLCVILMCSGMTIASFAADEMVYGSFTYTVSSGKVTIVGYPETGKGSVTIPSTIDGKTVVAIDDGAFQACTLITEVIIPDTVTSIGKYAFAYCVTLETVTIPSSVTSIGKNAFQNSKKVIIECESGSYAETYAKESGVPVSVSKRAFTLGKDNNSFFHWSNEDEGSGFFGVNNYSISDDLLWVTLCNIAYPSDSDLSAVIDTAESEWGGSCYGIASTIGMTYLGYDKISDISSVTASNYYEMCPYGGRLLERNPKLLDAIQFYQLLQNCDSSYGAYSDKSVFTFFGFWNKIYQYIDKFGKDTTIRGNADFWDELISIVRKEYIVLFGMEGHAVVTCGLEDLADGSVKIRIYDENALDTKTNYCYITIKDGKATYTNYDGTKQDFGEFSDRAGFISFSDLPVIKSSNFSTMSLADGADEISTMSLGGTDEISTYSSDPETMIVKINNSEDFSLVTDSGVLTVHGDDFESTLNIYDLGVTFDGDNTLTKIEIDKSKNIKYITSSTDSFISVKDGDNYYKVSGSNIDSTKINLEDSVTLTGNDYSFNVSVNRNNTEVVNFSGKSTDETVVKINDDNSVSINSDSEMKNLTVKELSVDDTKYIVEDEDVSEFTVYDNCLNVDVSDAVINYKSSATLSPVITADDGAEYTVTYSSDSKNVTVDENGKIYGAKKGSANITVTVTDTNGNVVTGTCKVTVEYAWWQWLIKIVLFGWIWY